MRVGCPFLAICLIGLGCGESSTAPTTVAAVAVSPPFVDLVIGDTTRLTAVARDSAGDTLAARPISWTSSDTAIAVVSSSGLVHARARGTARITATAEGQSGFSTAYVLRPPAALFVVPNSDTVYTGDSTAWLTMVIDSAGEQSLVDSVTWSVVDATVIRARPVQKDVWLIGLKPGVTWVKARSGSLSDSARIWVRNRVGSVIIVPDSAVMTIGDTLQLGATVRDTAGNVLTDRVVTWVVLLGPASIDAVGRLVATGAGSATVRAQAETQSDTAAFVFRISGRFVRIQTGDVHTCGLTTTGTAYCWGNGDYGQLGTGGGPEGNHDTPVLVGGHPRPAFGDIFAGWNHSCGPTAGGDSYCWGEMGFGALGNPAGEEFCVYGNPCRGTPLPVLGGLAFSELAIGFRTICGIAMQRAYCWGWNDVGQLGIGSFDNNAHSDPESVPLDSAASSIAAGYRFGCAVASGTAYCWGDNQYGQLGIGSISIGIVPHPTPDSVTGGHQFTVVAAGQYHACGLDTGGRAYCWGLNDVGELGTGATGTPIPNPSPVSGGLEFVSITAGVDHTCGIATDSLAYCWGGNSAGQLGDGTKESKAAPMPVSGSMKFVALDASRGFTCGVTSSQTAYCWGGNGFGRLGIGGFDQFQTTPAPVVGQLP